MLLKKVMLRVVFVPKAGLVLLSSVLLHAIIMTYILQDLQGEGIKHQQDN